MNLFLGVLIASSCFHAVHSSLVIHPLHVGTSDNHRFIIEGGLSIANVTLGSSICNIDSNLSNNRRVICWASLISEGQYPVEILDRNGDILTCDDCTVVAKESLASRAHIQHDAQGCAGDRLHVHGSGWSLENEHLQLSMKIGVHPVIFDGVASKVRISSDAQFNNTPLFAQSNVHQISARIPTGLAAGQYPVTVSIDAHPGHLMGHGSLRLVNMHDLESNNVVLIHPSIHSISALGESVVIIGSGFSLKPNEMTVLVKGVVCQVVQADYRKLVCNCHGDFMSHTPVVESIMDIGASIITSENNESRVRGEMEWPISNPAVEDRSHYQEGSFTAQFTEGTVFVAPMDGDYMFELHCQVAIPLQSKDECMFSIGDEVSLSKGESYPAELLFKHLTHGDHFRLSASIVSKAGEKHVFHTVPASWFRHEREHTSDVSVTVNGMKSICRGDCTLKYIVHKAHFEPMESHMQLERRVLRNLAVTLPAGTTGLSSFISSNNCLSATSDCIIPQGVHVHNDMEALDIGSLTIQGKFTWSDGGIDQQLRTGYLVVTGTGVFEMNVKSNKHVIYIKDNGKSHSMLGIRSMGTYSSQQSDSPVFIMKGGDISKTFSLLAKDANIGDNSLELDDDISAMNWKVGDRIVIAHSLLPVVSGNNVPGPEVFVIGAINGKTITIANSATVGQTYFGRPATRMQSEVINLSRNIIITGDDFSIGNQGLHIVSHSPGGYMKIKRTRVEKCGQRGALGKYCLHFHRKGVCTECEFENNAIEDSHQRGLVIHGTHRSTVKGNVLYTVRGAGIYIEDGNEIENVIQDNVNICHASSQDSKACAAPGTDNDQADDVQQSGIWVLSVTNSFIGNRVVNHYNALFTQTTAFPYGKGSSSFEVCTKHSPLGIFKDNVHHSNWRFGFYLDSNFPRQLSRSIATDGLVSDMAACNTANDMEACSCSTFKADGMPNGLKGVVEGGLDYGNDFVGQYDLGDVAYLSYTGINNLKNMYWKTTNNFQDGVSSHIKDSVFGWYNGIFVNVRQNDGSTTRVNYPGAGVAHILGPGGHGAFIIENTRFFGHMVESGIAANQHCTVGPGTGALCTPEYLLINNQYDEMPDNMKWFRFGVSDGNPELPMFTSFDSFLPGHPTIRSIASKYMTHLLTMQDSQGAAICRPSSEINMATQLDSGIVCTKQLRRLQVWTDGDRGQLELEAPGGGKYMMKYIEPCPGPGTSCIHKRGYGAAVIVDPGTSYTYKINTALANTDAITFEFSDIIFTQRFNAEDAITLLYNSETCSITSSHDRLFIGPYGPFQAGRGACKGNADMANDPAVVVTGAPVQPGATRSPAPELTLAPTTVAPDDHPCFKTDVDYFGNDLSHQSDVASAESCQAICRSTQDCSYWTFVDPARSTVTGIHNFCYLKVKATQGSNDESFCVGCVSGPKECLIKTNQPSLSPTIGICTKREEDPWSTGTKVECCNRDFSCLNNWSAAEPDKFFYICKETCRGETKAPVSVREVTFSPTTLTSAATSSSLGTGVGIAVLFVAIVGVASVVFVRHKQRRMAMKDKQINPYSL